MTITITNIFTVTDKCITVKKIVLMIKVCIFAPKRIMSLCNSIPVDPAKKTLDNSTHPNMMIIL